MSETAFTPGPWSLNTTYSDIEVRGPAESGGLLIAVMWRAPADTLSPQVADARLIASAPAMHAELTRLRRDNAALLAAAIKAKQPLELYRAYGWSDRAGVINQLAAAIAQAQEPT